jgi:hypothetical protein
MALVALPRKTGGVEGKVDSGGLDGLSTARTTSSKTAMIDKTYQPSEVEGRIYGTWEQAGAFRAGQPGRAGAKPYSIVIPPPNVTGSLHMGHALNNTLQDILCRFPQAGLGLEGRERRHDRQSVKAPRGLLRLVARALHDG